MRASGTSGRSPTAARSGPVDEPQSVPRIAPVRREPADRDDPVEDGNRDGDVSEGEDRDRQGDCEAQPWIEPAGEAGREYEDRDELGRPEGKERRTECGRHDTESHRKDASSVAACRCDRLLDLRLGALPPARFATLRLSRRVAQLGGQVRRAGSPARLDRERCIDCGDQAAGQTAPLRGERGRAGLDRPRDLLDRHAPERVPVGEGLPEQDADRPDVALRARIRAGESLGRDVGERAGDVADGGQRVRAVELREPEIEQPHGDLVAILEQDVRRLHVAMDDSGAMCVREGVEHLRGGGDRILVRESTRADRVAHGATRHVLVRDVDVARVVPDVVGAYAAVVAQPAGGEGFALRARRSLALARDDLQRDVEAVLLVQCEPDGARAARSERPHGPIAAEDELLGGWDSRDGGHR